MHILAIMAPVIGAIYLIHQIHRRDLRSWQHYACVTSLIFLISVLFLVGGGRIKSFGLAGNTVEVVDAKLEEIRELTEQNKRIAQKTVALVIKAASDLLAAEEFDDAGVQRSQVELLKAAGLSESEIQRFLKENNKPDPSQSKQ